MVDTVTKEVRSRIMGRIRSRDTKPEVAVRSLLHRMGFRFRLQGKDLPGSPDIVLPKWKTCVFVQGCFWHRHAGCPVANMPKSNSRFWRNKFRRNVARDRRNQSKLPLMGWNVVIVWECELRDGKKLGHKLSRIRKRKTPTVMDNMERRSGVRIASTLGRQWSVQRRLATMLLA